MKNSTGCVHKFCNNHQIQFTLPDKGRIESAIFESKLLEDCISKKNNGLFLHRRDTIKEQQTQGSLDVTDFIDLTVDIGDGTGIILWETNFLAKDSSRLRISNESSDVSLQDCKPESNIK